MKITDHLLSDDDIIKAMTPNTSGEFAAGQPDTVVIHYTGGSSAESSVRHLCKETAGASAHLVIGRDAKVYQLAPFNIITWHAGRSSWDDRHGLNKYSIGIELDNAGELKDNGNGQYFSWFNRSYTGSDVYQGVHRNRTMPSFWHAYTHEQIDKAFEICHLLHQHYGINTILGHEEIAPARKTDPGPAFPLERLREEVLTDNRHSESASEAPESESGSAVVEATRLNIRSGPGVQYESVGEPLLNGAIVRPVRTSDGWTEVEYTVRGWVSSRYIKPVG